MPVLIFTYFIIGLLICKYDLFWQEVCVKSLKFWCPLRPVGLLLFKSSVVCNKVWVREYTYAFTKSFLDKEAIVWLHLEINSIFVAFNQMSLLSTKDTSHLLLMSLQIICLIFSLCYLHNQQKAEKKTFIQTLKE